MQLELSLDDVRGLLERPPYAGNQLLATALQFPRSPKLTDVETIHYFLVYEGLFRALRQRAIRLLEIGVLNGDSLRLWQSYFPHALVYGVDVSLRPEATGLPVFIGDQQDVDFLDTVVKQAGPFDVIIDDGSHVMRDQIASLRYLFPHGLAADGLYVIEDLCTSYWRDWGGGLEAPGTTLGYVKGLVDALNYRAHKGGRRGYRGTSARIPPREQLVLDDFDESLVSISFSRSLCWLRKGDNRSLDAVLPTHPSNNGG